MATSQMTTTMSVVNEVAVLDSTNVEYLIKQLNDAKRLEKEAKEKREAADKAIRNLLGDAMIGTVGGAVRVEITPVVREGIDRDLLRSLHSEAYDACKTQTEYTRLITK